MPERFAEHIIGFQRTRMHMDCDERVVARTAMLLRYCLGPLLCLAALLTLADALG